MKLLGNDFISENRQSAEQHFLDFGMDEFRANGFVPGQWPHTITAQAVTPTEVDGVVKGVSAFMRVAERVLYAASNDPLELQVRYGLTANQVSMFDFQAEHDWAGIARPDVVWSDGRPIVVETNIGPSLGGLAISDMLLDCLLQWDQHQEVVPPTATWTHTMRALVSYLTDEYQLRGGETLAICWWDRESSPMPGRFYSALKHSFQSFGFRCFTCPLDALDLTGHAAYLDGKRIDAVYRFFDEEPELPQQAAILTRFCHLVNIGAVQLLGSFFGDVFTSKVMIADVLEALHSSMATQAETDAIQRVFPLTRRLTADPASRNGLVLKPSDGHGGSGLVFGDTVTDSTWERAWNDARNSNHLWVTQEMLEQEREEVWVTHSYRLVPAQHYIVTGVFIVGRQYGGGLQRTAPSLNVNPSLGAFQGPLVVLAQE